jgi:hypothetical protein
MPFSDEQFRDVVRQLVARQGRQQSSYKMKAIL